MADLTITQLPADATLTGTEELPIWDAGVTKKTTIAQVNELAPVQSVNGETGVVVLDAADVGADPGGTASGLIATHESTYNHGLLHSPVTVTDSSSINLTLTGQDITADAIFGTTSGTVAQGNDPRFVTNGDSHDHSGGAGAQLDHANLLNKGTNTHTQIDTALSRLSNTSGTNTGDQDLSTLATKTEVTAGLATKQATLVSGTNIKTLNGSSVLGSGDLVVGHTIQDEGVALAARTNLDFVGTAVTVTDDPANDKTIVTVNASGVTDGDKGNVTVSNSGATWTVDSVDGNLDFLGTAARIRGDFSNATVANRTMFQTSTVNGATVVPIIPNGTGNYSEVSFYSTVDVSNAVKFDFSVSPTLSRIRNNAFGTATQVPLSFEVENTERLRIDTSGNVLVTGGIGLGYGTGAGGTVTQATSKSTAVTLNKPCGQITMNNAALGAGATATFQVNNSLVGATDVVVTSAHGNWVNYTFNTICYSGSFYVVVKNVSAGSLSEAVVINFAIIKGAIS